MTTIGEVFSLSFMFTSDRICSLYDYDTDLRRLWWYNPRIMSIALHRSPTMWTSWISVVLSEYISSEWTCPHSSPPNIPFILLTFQRWLRLTLGNIIGDIWSDRQELLTREGSDLSESYRKQMSTSSSHRPRHFAVEIEKDASKRRRMIQAKCIYLFTSNEKDDVPLPMLWICLADGKTRIDLNILIQNADAHESRDNSHSGSHNDSTIHGSFFLCVIFESSIDRFMTCSYAAVTVRTSVRLTEVVNDYFLTSSNHVAFWCTTIESDRDKKSNAFVSIIGNATDADERTNTKSI